MPEIFRNSVFLILLLSSSLLASDTLGIKERMEILNASSPISFIINEAVKEKITFYSTKAKGLVSRSLGLGELYFPMIESELAKNNIPSEFKYIAAMESGLNPSAGNEKGPYGLWQFTYGTAQVMGMKMNADIDDRKDPQLSTQAACLYFTKLYKIYGDWLMVLAAYNAGSGNVNKAIKESGGKKTYWEIRAWLPKSTKEYIPSFMGICYVFNYAKEFNINVLYPKFTSGTIDTVYIRQSVSFEQIAKVLELNLSDLVFLNQKYKRRVIPFEKGNKAYMILPMGNSANFYREEKRIYNYE